jgi:hypothetical protein
MGCGELKIRSYDVQVHRAGVEELERRCEVGPTERVLCIDTMGDPICRIRNSPMCKMLVRAHYILIIITLIYFSLPLFSLHPLSLKPYIGVVTSITACNDVLLTKKMQPCFFYVR